MSYNAVDKTTGNLIRIAGNASAGGGGGQYWATCNNQAANQIKIVTVSSDQNFVLEKNAIIFVKFDAANTYAATAADPVKLNVNGTGDKNVYYANTNAPTGTNTTAFGRQNYINQYVYDGTNWVWQGSSSDNDTTNKVVQTVTTENADYEVLFSNTADNTTRTEGARKNSNLKFNPSTGNLQTTKINNVTVGNSPKFTDTTYSAASNSGITLNSSTNEFSNSGVRSVAQGTTNGTVSVNTNGTTADVAVKGFSDKQDKTDNSLTTTSKTVVGAINEVNNGLTNLSKGYFKASVTSGKWYKIADMTATTWRIHSGIIAIGGILLKKFTFRYDATNHTFNNNFTKLESITGIPGYMAMKFGDNAVTLYYKAGQTGTATYSVLTDGEEGTVNYYNFVETDLTDADMDLIES